MPVVLSLVPKRLSVRPRSSRPTLSSLYSVAPMVRSYGAALMSTPMERLGSTSLSVAAVLGASMPTNSFRKPALACNAILREKMLSRTVALSGSLTSTSSAAVTASPEPSGAGSVSFFSRPLSTLSLSSSSTVYCERSTLTLALGPKNQLRST